MVLWRSGNDVGALTMLASCCTSGPVSTGTVAVFGRANRPLGQLSLLPSSGREVSTSQSAAVLCGWETWLIQFVDKRVDVCVIPV